MTRTCEGLLPCLYSLVVTSLRVRRCSPRFPGMRTHVLKAKLLVSPPAHVCAFSRFPRSFLSENQRDVILADSSQDMAGFMVIYPGVSIGEPRSASDQSSHGDKGAQHRTALRSLRHTETYPLCVHCFHSNGSPSLVPSGLGKKDSFFGKKCTILDGGRGTFRCWCAPWCLFAS